MHIYYDKTREKQEMDFSGTVHELLDKLEINAETVVVTQNNTVVTDDTKLSNEDDVKILSVVSGG